MRAAEEAGRMGSVALATFDISPQVLEAVQNENMLFAIDQQMFLQTYQSAVSLVNYVQYRLRPVEAVPSGPLFITKDEAGEIIELSDQGIH
jgi:simple sugar transport system substrate-binding protein